MTLSHVSDEQLSRAIAEYLEPRPTTTSIPEQPSLLGFWRSVYRHDAYRGTTEWAHRDMVNDPAMILMLLKSLIGERYDLLFAWQRESECIGDVPYIDFIGKHIRPMKKDLSDIGRAVAEAYALANHLEVKP